MWCPPLKGAGLCSDRRPHYLEASFILAGSFPSSVMVGPGEPLPHGWVGLRRGVAPLRRPAVRGFPNLCEFRERPSLQVLSLCPGVLLCPLTESPPLLAQLRIQLKHLGDPARTPGALPTPAFLLSTVCAPSFSPFSRSHRDLCFGSPARPPCSAGVPCPTQRAAGTPHQGESGAGARTSSCLSAFSRVL